MTDDMTPAQARRALNDLLDSYDGLTLHGIATEQNDFSAIPDVDDRKRFRAVVDTLDADEITRKALGPMAEDARGIEETTEGTRQLQEEGATLPFPIEMDVSVIGEPGRRQVEIEPQPRSITDLRQLENTFAQVYPSERKQDDPVMSFIEDVADRVSRTFGAELDDMDRVGDVGTLTVRSTGLFTFNPSDPAPEPEGAITPETVDDDDLMRNTYDVNISTATRSGQAEYDWRVRNRMPDDARERALEGIRAEIGPADQYAHRASEVVGRLHMTSPDGFSFGDDARWFFDRFEPFDEFFEDEFPRRGSGGRRPGDTEPTQQRPERGQQTLAEAGTVEGLDQFAEGTVQDDPDRVIGPAEEVRRAERAATTGAGFESPPGEGLDRFARLTGTIRATMRQDPPTQVPDEDGNVVERPGTKTVNPYIVFDGRHSADFSLRGAVESAIFSAANVDRMHERHGSNETVTIGTVTFTSGGTELSSIDLNDNYIGENVTPEMVESGRV